MIRAIEPDRLPLRDEPAGFGRYREAMVTALDGITIFARHYLANFADSARTLFIVHGMSEHGQRYDHIAQLAVTRGWNVVISDLRGHGRSGGAPTHVEDFRQYIDDLRAVHVHFGLRPESTAILAHSMGGLVTARMLQQEPNCASAVVLTSPLLGVKVEISPFTIALGKAMSLVYPQTRFRSRVDQCFTTRNVEVLERRANDPYIHRSVTAGWYFAMESALKAVWADVSRFSCPIFLLQAGQDRIVDPAMADPWLGKVSSVDKTFRLFPEHYHELLNEPDWPEIAAEVFNWLDGRVKALVSA
jgi:lysophospholipase